MEKAYSIIKIKFIDEHTTKIKINNDVQVIVFGESKIKLDGKKRLERKREVSRIKKLFRKRYEFSKKYG